jgi:hypothetical protein
MTDFRDRVRHRCHAGVVAILLICVSAQVYAADSPEISLDEPVRVGESIHVGYSIVGLFDTEILTALESGLPATLAVRWRLYRVRPIWWDSRLDEDASHFRIIYDVLEEQYVLFDETGRRMETCANLEDVSRVLCMERTVSIPDAPRLKERDRHYIVIEAELEPLDLEEIRDLEGWLSGGEEEGEGEGGLSALSDHTMRLLKDLVGLGERSVRGQTAHFRGWR